MKHIFLGLIFSIVLCNHVEAANTYYVGKSGTGNCTSARNNPAASGRVSTIAAGVACLAGGDTLVIGAGTYDEMVGFSNALNDATIPSGTGPGGEAIEAAWPGATIIKGENPCTGMNTSTPTCQTVVRPSTAANCASAAVVWVAQQTVRNYIIFQDFEADGNNLCPTVGRISTQYDLPAPHHIRAQRVYWHNNSAPSTGGGLIGIGAALINSTWQVPPHHIELLDSVFTDGKSSASYAVAGSYCAYWSGSGAIRRNIFKNCGNSPIKDGAGITTHNGPGGYTVDISGNDLDGFGFWGIAAECTVNTKIYNNIVRNGGLTPAEATSMGGSVEGAGIVINGTCGASGTFVANNTVYNIQTAGGGASILRRIPSGTSNTTIQNNIVFTGTNPTITGGSDGGPAPSNNRCDSGCATAVDPQFVNAAGGNFHLTASSPAAITQNGVNLNSTFTTDKDGIVWGSTWGLGAYKFSSVTLTRSPASVAQGTPITATWSGISAPDPQTWIAIFVPGAANSAYGDWVYLNCTQTATVATSSGSCSIPTSGESPGTYELRLFADNSFSTVLATSATFTITLAAPAAPSNLIIIGAK